MVAKHEPMDIYGSPWVSSQGCKREGDAFQKIFKDNVALIKDFNKCC